MDKMDKSISRLSIKQSIALRRLTKTEVVGNKSFEYKSFKYQQNIINYIYNK